MTETVEKARVPVTTAPQRRDWATGVRALVLGALLIIFVIAAQRTGQLGRLGWTAVTILAVVVASGAVFASSNAVVSLASRSWARYRTLIGGLLGAVGFSLLRGNRSVGALISEPEVLLLGDGEPLDISDNPDLIGILRDIADPELIERATGWLGLIEWPILGALLGAAAGAATGAFANRVVRIAGAAFVALVAGWLIADNLLYANRPDLSLVTLLVWLAIGLAVGAAVGALTHDLIPRMLMAGAIGTVVGAWLAPPLSTGSLWDTRLATMVPLLMLALRFAWPSARTTGELVEFNRRARAFVFLAPALGFLAINLVVPALRTIYTSVLDRESEEFVGLDNYQTLFAADDFIDLSNWTNIFTSQLFVVGLVLLVSGFLIGAFIHRTRNGVVGLERTAGSVGPILVGIFLLFFAAFSVIRGTFPNTLWWMFTVTIASTVMGLVISVLAERAGRLEAAAKSLIFMPMAISFVGASIIWRFQYQPRNISKDQSGVLNALWIELGKFSHSGWPRIVALIVLGALIAVTAAKIYEQVRNGGSFAGLGTALIVITYLFIELARRSLGGFAFAGDGSIIADTIAFREEVRPFNNVYLMFIMVWIQSGFAMVILSAAIKAVPEELLEAAQIDGASESQRFFRVVLPQILPTIGVVVTATVVAVVKVFDIVKVSTGGNFGTNVLANDFFTVAFQFFDRGRGSAIAVVILLTVAPILILNVRQMQREAV